MKLTGNNKGDDGQWGWGTLVVETRPGLGDVLYDLGLIAVVRLVCIRRGRGKKKKRRGVCVAAG